MNTPEHKTTEYRTWVNMIQRCENPRHISYKDYGAKGITVCAEWRHNYKAFLAHVGRKPSPKHSIDRINSAGNYEPGNVRWATRLEQGRNRRQGLLTVNGVTRHIWEWGELSGIPRRVISLRVRRGMSAERAISRPVGVHVEGDPERQPFGERAGNVKLTLSQVREIQSLKASGLSVAAIARRYGISESGIRGIIKGKSWRRALSNGVAND